MDSDGNRSVSTGQDELPNLLAFLGFRILIPRSAGSLRLPGSTWQHLGISTWETGIPEGNPVIPNVTWRYQTSHPKYKHRGIFGYWGVFSIRVQSVLSIVKSNPCQNRSSPHLNPYNILPTIIGFRSFPPAR